MSFESIIGIIASLITIFLAVKGAIFVARKWFLKPPISTLFTQLLNQELTDKERRVILKKLNDYDLINNRIKEQYIQNFALENRKQEALLFDICDSNDIEPTIEICKNLIGNNMPSLRTKYLEKRQNKKESTTPTDSQTIDSGETGKFSVESGVQVVYMSELLKTNYPETCSRLIKILEIHDVKYAFLKGTKDIWCRDYMPIQIESGKFIQFKYDPSYLKGNKEWEASRSDVKEVCRVNGVEAQFSDINLDGGNVLICDGKAILSNRIFSENSNWDKEKLVNELSKLLECEIIIIPAENDDMTGHADGMVRFVNRNTILGNKLADEYKYWREGMEKVIEQFDLKYIDVPFFSPKDPKHPHSAIGIYVNYLEVNNLIVLPVFGKDEDEQAVDVLRQAFPDRVIETIDYNDVAWEGGLLNCTTWVVR